MPRYSTFFVCLSIVLSVLTGCTSSDEQTTDEVATGAPSKELSSYTVRLGDKDPYCPLSRTMEHTIRRYFAEADGTVQKTTEFVRRLELAPDGGTTASNGDREFFCYYCGIKGWDGAYSVWSIDSIVKGDKTKWVLPPDPAKFDDDDRGRLKAFQQSVVRAREIRKQRLYDELIVSYCDQAMKNEAVESCRNISDGDKTLAAYNATHSTSHRANFFLNPSAQAFDHYPYESLVTFSWSEEGEVWYVAAEENRSKLKESVETVTYWFNKIVGAPFRWIGRQMFGG